jgi:transcription elongation factor GreB
MNKAFVKESDEDEFQENDGAEPSLPADVPNYLTPNGHQRLKDELLKLLDIDRPEVVRLVAWAASNGDRSENGDYLYGKKRLREIDRRIRFLTKRLERAHVVDPATQTEQDQVFFGATVDYEDDLGQCFNVKIVGVDETDLPNGHISWVSPVATALRKARVGDVVSVQTPSGRRELEVTGLRYQ